MTGVNSGLANNNVLSIAALGTNVFAETAGSGIWRRSLSDMLSSTILLSRSVISFDSVRVRSTKVDSIEIKNSSPVPLIIDSVYTGTKWFRVASAHETVYQSDTMTLHISFSPDTLRVYSDTLFILSNASVPLTKVFLSGTGVLYVGANFSVSPSLLDFGGPPKGQTKTDTLTVSNLGDDTLKASAFSQLKGLTFQPDSFIVPPAGYVRVLVTLVASDSGNYSGQIYFNSNAPSSPDSVSVYGLITAIMDENNLPTKFALYQNYPNPFNPTTTIKYALPKRSQVRIEVYNVLGERVASLVNDVERAGTHSVKFDGAELPSGVYFYRIIAGSYTAMKKMVVIK